MEAFLKAEAGLPFVNIENRNPKPPTDAVGNVQPFVSALYVASESAHSLGDPDKRCWRELGTVMALFFWPSNTGVGNLITTIDAFRAKARGRQWTQSNWVLDIEKADPAIDYASLRWAHSLGDYLIRAVVLGYRYDFSD